MLPRVFALVRGDDELALVHLVGQEFDGIFRQIELDPLGKLDNLSFGLRDFLLGLEESQFFLLFHA